jgi:hypothetical protein
MANTCYNWIEIVGETKAIEKLRKRLVAENEADIREVTEPGLLVFSMESRWVAPVEWLEEISREYSVNVECESEECGCDYWNKIGFRNGEKIFDIELGYLEGKYNSLDWNDFIECEVMWRLDNDESLDDFIEQFENFCTDDEIAELKDIFKDHIIDNQND